MKRTLTELLATWNAATAPYIHRSEHEHHRQAALARAVMNRLNRGGFREGVHYHESDYTGRLLHGSG